MRLALAERFGDVESAVHVRRTIGSAYLVADDERGVASIQGSLDLAQAEGLDAHVANAFGNLGSGLWGVHR